MKTGADRHRNLLLKTTSILVVILCIFLVSPILPDYWGINKVFIRTMLLGFPEVVDYEGLLDSEATCSNEIVQAFDRIIQNAGDIASKPDISYLLLAIETRCNLTSRSRDSERVETLRSGARRTLVSYFLGLHEFRIGNFEEAAGYWDDVLPMGAVLRRLAYETTEQGNNELSVSLLKTLAEMEPELSLKLWLARTLINSRDYASAEKLLLEDVVFIDLYSRQVESEAAWRLLLELWQIQGEWSEIWNRKDKLEIQLGRQDVDLLVALARSAFEGYGDYPLARAYLTAASQVSSQDALWPYFFLGEYARREGQHDEAESWLTKAVHEASSREISGTAETVILLSRLSLLRVYNTASRFSESQALFDTDEELRNLPAARAEYCISCANGECDEASVVRYCSNGSN